jgi:tetratricopeptide (TPR) repeat protein
MIDAYALNRLADAVPFLNKAGSLDPGDPENAISRATVLIDLGEVSTAMQLIEEVVRKWPRTSYQSSAAAILATGGDWDAANRSARTALENDPRDANAVYLLANADLKNGDASAARARYAKAYPDLLASAPPQIDGSNFFSAVSLAFILQEMGDEGRASQLLDGSERTIRSITRLGIGGYGITDARIHALRGNKAKALTALREAANAGWRGPLWRFYRDFDPALGSIREEREFKAVFADIERDMERQRAELAGRPKDAPLDLAHEH